MQMVALFLQFEGLFPQRLHTILDAVQEAYHIVPKTEERRPIRQLELAKVLA